MAFNNGKRNQHGKVQYTSCLRNKDPMFCSFFSLGALFFVEFQVNGKEFPSFADRSNWYDFVVFAGTTRGNSVGRNNISKKQLYDIFRIPLDALNIQSYKVTHLGRLFAMLFCHAEGVPDPEINRQGTDFDMILIC
jgi:hypothetical protein